MSFKGKKEVIIENLIYCVDRMSAEDNQRLAIVGLSKNSTFIKKYRFKDKLFTSAGLFGRRMQQKLRWVKRM